PPRLLKRHLPQKQFPLQKHSLLLKPLPQRCPRLTPGLSLLQKRLENTSEYALFATATGNFKYVIHRKPMFSCKYNVLFKTISIAAWLSGNSSIRFVAPSFPVYAAAHFKSWLASAPFIPHNPRNSWQTT
ncbi:MAG: hypothetical protein LBM56_03960, partial [Burkholderiaceae bacterium]|nr:hypothetical protein [Burkholderiaceae bacterium]